MREGTQPRPAARVEWWIRVVPALLALHLAVAGALRARPGLVSVYLWYVAPAALALLAVLTLLAALVATIRQRGTWSVRRVVAYTGLVVVAGAVPFYRTYPSSHDGRPSAVRFRLPLDGPVTVAWGGPTSDVNYHVVQPDQRWAYDLLVLEDGTSHRGDGRALAALQEIAARYPGRLDIVSGDALAVDVRDALGPERARVVLDAQEALGD